MLFGFTADLLVFLMFCIIFGLLVWKSKSDDDDYPRGPRFA